MTFRSEDKSLPQTTDIRILEGNSEGHDYIVGDVHGSVNQLKALLKVAKKGDRIIIVGDLTDKGPDSLGVVEMIMRNNQNPDNPQIHVTRGNHEEELIKYYDMFQQWKNSGNPTKPEALVKHEASYGIAMGQEWAIALANADPEKFPDAAQRLKNVVDYYRTLPYILHVKESPTADAYNVGHADLPFSHAVLMERIARGELDLSPDDKNYMIWARAIAGKDGTPAFRPKLFSPDNVIFYCGHSPLGGVRYSTFSINLDMKTYISSNLVVMDHHTKQLLFVNPQNKSVGTGEYATQINKACVDILEFTTLHKQIRACLRLKRILEEEELKEPEGNYKTVKQFADEHKIDSEAFSSDLRRAKKILHMIDNELLPALNTKPDAKPYEAFFAFQTIYNRMFALTDKPFAKTLTKSLADELNRFNQAFLTDNIDLGQGVRYCSMASGRNWFVGPDYKSLDFAALPPAIDRITLMQNLLKAKPRSTWGDLRKFNTCIKNAADLGKLINGLPADAIGDDLVMFVSSVNVHKFLRTKNDFLRLILEIKSEDMRNAAIKFIEKMRVKLAPAPQGEEVKATPDAHALATYITCFSNVRVVLSTVATDRQVDLIEIRTQLDVIKASDATFVEKQEHLKKYLLEKYCYLRLSPHGAGSRLATALQNLLLNEFGMDIPKKIENPVMMSNYFEDKFNYDREIENVCHALRTAFPADAQKNIDAQMGRNNKATGEEKLRLVLNVVVQYWINTNKKSIELGLFKGTEIVRKHQHDLLQKMLAKYHVIVHPGSKAMDVQQAEAIVKEQVRFRRG